MTLTDTLESLPSNSSAEGSSTSERINFALAMLTMGLVWMFLLPWLGSQSPVAQHIETQQRLRIDPSALFYTELEMLPEIVHHEERLHDSYHTELWSLSRK